MSPGIKALKGFRLVFKLHKRKKNIQKIWKLSLKVMAETYDYCHNRLIFSGKNGDFTSKDGSAVAYAWWIW